jgi:hypothetical protein
MSFANLYNGKLLIRNGKLAIGENCCCDCPECPPLDTLPQLCYLKVTVPSSLMITGQSVELFLIYTGDYVSRPQWTKEVVNGVCYYNYAIDLSMPCCVHRCDDSCEIPLSTSPLVCGPYGSGWNCSPTCASGTVDDECVGTVDITYDGVIKATIRDVISDATATVEYKYNCNTGEIQRKLTVKYIYSNTLSARFVGTATYDYTADENEDPPACCSDACQIVVNYNNGLDDPPFDDAPEDGCFYEPQIPSLDAPADYHSDNWMNPTACFLHGTYGEVSYSENWTTVGGLFDDTSLSFDFVAPPDGGRTALHACPQVESGDVEFLFELSEGADYGTLEFDCADAIAATYTAWSCGDAGPESVVCSGFPGMTRMLKNIGDDAGSHAIDFITTTDQSLTACSEWESACQPGTEGELI